MVASAAWLLDMVTVGTWQPITSAWITATRLSVASCWAAVARSQAASPLVTVALTMLILSGVFHMRLGMQTVIEDYIHAEGLKIALLMLNTFFAMAVGATCILAVLKLAFGS